MALKKSYTVKGMHCEKCVARVKEALEGIDGVRAARVSLEKENAIVKMDVEVPDETILAAIKALDFEAAVQQ